MSNSRESNIIKNTQLLIRLDLEQNNNNMYGFYNIVNFC